MEENKIIRNKAGGSSGETKRDTAETGTDARKFAVTVTGTANGTWQGTVRHSGRETAFQSELELLAILSGAAEPANGKE